MADTSRTGKDAYIKFGSTELDAEYRTMTWGETAQFVDGSSGSDNYVKNKDTLSDLNLSLELVGPEGTAGTAMWDALAPKTEGTLEFGPDGTASGNPRRRVLCKVETREETSPYTDIITWNVTWKATGDPDYTPYT
jgi:hypothetical protein